MKTIAEKELKAWLQKMMQDEKGKASTELQRAYQRGWRDAVRSVRYFIRHGDPS